MDGLTVHISQFITSLYDNGSFNSWMHLLSGIIFDIGMVWFFFPIVGKIMTDPICVLLADDHAVVWAGIRQFIRALHPIYLEDLGLVAALNMLAHDEGNRINGNNVSNDQNGVVS